MKAPDSITVHQLLTRDEILEVERIEELAS